MTLVVISSALGIISVLLAVSAGTIRANGERGAGMFGIILALSLMAMSLALMAIAGGLIT